MKASLLTVALVFASPSHAAPVHRKLQLSVRSVGPSTIVITNTSRERYHDLTIRLVVGLDSTAMCVH